MDRGQVVLSGGKADMKPEEVRKLLAV